ncbi:MAG: TonB-dependent receptor, partial [Flavobacteriales bacterium]|nr:TonB-dependent receptor [Flavobacteriales bacterium]
PCILSSQTTRVHGQVFSKEDGSTLPGVQVIISKNQGTISNAEGRFEVEADSLPITLQFRMLGYETTYVEVEQAGIPVTVRMQESVQMLQQVVVSAGRFEQDLAEVTVSMEVLRPDLVRDRNITALDDALRESPGMIIVDGEPQIRSGSGYSFGAGSRVQVLLDHIPQLSGDIGRPTWSNIPMEAVDQVEVIKGAASVLYGSAALSGIVHVRSLYPGSDPETRINYYAGAYALPPDASNRYWENNNLIIGQQVTHAQQLGSNDLVFSIDLLDDDGHLGPRVDSTGTIEPKRSPADASHFAAERRARGFIKYRHRDQQIEGLVYGVNLLGQKRASVATLLWDNIDTGLYSAFAGSATETRQTVFNINPFIEYRHPKGHAATWRGNWSSLDNANDNDQDNFSDTYFSEFQFQLDGTAWGAEGLRTTLGLAQTWSESDSEIFNNGGLDPFHSSQNTGLYLQSDYALGERIHLSGGVRWERFEIDGETDSRPVFRAGVNYQAGRATYFRASYGQGYRFPTIGERYITTAVGVLNIYPNPGLEAETSSNLEVGVKQGFAFGAFKGFADVAFFRQEFENYIEFTFGQWADSSSLDNLLGLGFTSLNTGSAEVSGAELSIGAEGELSKKNTLRLLMGYTYTLPITTSPDLIYARSETQGIPIEAFREVSYRSTSSDPENEILKYRMQHLIRLNADLESGRSSIGFGVRYNSFMENIDGIFEELDDGESLGGLLPSGVSRWRDERDKGDVVFDLRMGYQFLDEHRFSVVIDNLLNREYAIRPLALESPRRVVLRMSLVF